MKTYSPYSDLKIFYHTDKVDKFIRGERSGPVYIRIKPTNLCNQRCYYCVYANDKVFDEREVDRGETIPWNVLRRTLYEMGEMGVKAVTFSGGGEPLCYPYLVDALKILNENKIEYSLITNGQALCGDVVDFLKKAKWIRVSLDSASKETYERIRGVNTFEKVINNIRTFADEKDASCTLGINCVVTSENAKEVFNICKLVKGLGVDNIKLSPILVKKDEKKYHDAIKDSVMKQIEDAKFELEDEKFRIVDKYSNDEALEGKYEKTYTKCYIQKFFTVIAADSKVYRCHQRAYTKAGEIGDLSQKSFKEIWYAQETIENVNQFCPKDECKFRCAFDERNKLLDDFVNMDLNHVNFI